MYPRFVLLLSAGILLFLLLAGLSLEQDERDAPRRPQPLTPHLLRQDGLEAQDRRQIKRERKDYKRQREAWKEQLHRCAPDTDWRERDREARRRLQRERAQAPAPTLRDNGREVLGSWQERGSSNQAGRMHLAALAGEDVLYAASSGGIVWRGDLDGAAWQSLNDGQRFADIQGLAWLPGDELQAARLLVLHKGDSMLAWRDEDQGNWQLASGLEGPVGWGWPLRLACPGGDDVLLLAAEWDHTDWEADAGLYHSADRGQSFQRVAWLDEDPARVDLWYVEGAGSGLLAVGNELFSLQADGSTTPLATIPAVHGEDAVNGTLIDATAQGQAALCVALSGASEIYRGNLDGSGWVHGGSAPLTAFMRNSFCVDRLEPNRFYLGGVDAWITEDGGSSWNRVNNWWEYYDDIENKLHADIPGIQSLVDTEGEGLWIISTDGGTYTSRDGLESVRNISLQGLRIGQYYGSYSHQAFPDIVYAGAQDQGFQRSIGEEQGLYAFEQTISGDYAQLVSGDGGWSLWCVYPGFVMHYPDAVSGSQALFWDFTQSGHYWLPPLLADPLDPDRIWLGGGGSDGQSRLFSIRDTGGSLQAEEEDFVFSADSPIAAMALSPMDPLRRYLITGDEVFFTSSDGGGNWQVTEGFNGPQGHYFHGSDIVASPVEEGRLWICGSGYDNPPVYTSADHGQTFQPFSVGLPNTLVYAMALSDDGQWLFAASELGPFAWDGDEQSWQDLAGSEAPDQVYWNVEWVEGLQSARFVTYGRGIWDFALQETGLAETRSTRPAQPGFRALPNPANPGTRFQFTVEVAGRTLIEVFDLRGAKVVTVLDADMPAGEHQLGFSGEGLASGLYIARLETPQGVASLRLSLVK